MEHKLYFNKAVKKKKKKTSLATQMSVNIRKDFYFHCFIIFHYLPNCGISVQWNAREELKGTNYSYTYH